MAYSISAAEANFINETARYDIDVMHPAVSVVDLLLVCFSIAQPIDMVHDCTVKKIC